MSHTRIRIALARGGAALVLALASCGDAGPDDAGAAPIPLPDLEKVDPEVIEAIQGARAGVAREPDASSAWGKLGDRYSMHDFMAEAAVCYARAEELAPDSFVWPYRLGWSLLDEPERALAPFERALRSLDDYGPAHEISAYTLVRAGRSEEAIAPYERASELAPDAPHPESGLGQIYLERGDLARAGLHFKNALARDANHGAGHTGMAQVALALGQEKKAQNHAQISRSLPPDMPRFDVWASPTLPPAGARLRTEQGKRLEGAGRAAEAEDQYRLALAANPDYYPARTSLARVLMGRGEREAALALMREGEQHHPDLQQVRADTEQLIGAVTEQAKPPK